MASTGLLYRGCFGLIVASLLVVPAALAQTVPNDNFADAELLATDGGLVGTNVGATAEPGEPDHAFNTPMVSVWYRWTAPSDGFFTIDTFGSAFDTILAMYTGTAVDALTEVAANDDSGGLQSLLADVPVTGGTVYSIAVDGWGGATGQIDLEWSFLDGTDTTPPQVTIASPSDGAAYTQGTTVIASYSCVDEPLGSGVLSCIGDVPSGDPIDTSTLGAFTFTVTGTDNAGNVSVEVSNYTIQADTTPPVVVITRPGEGAAYPQGSLVTAAYSCTDEPLGSGIASCDGDVPSGDPLDTSALGAFTFDVTGIDNAGNVGVASVNYSVVEGLPNDNFVNAEPLATDGTLIGTNVGASKEAGEPNHAFHLGGASVWYRWTAPGDGYLTIDTFGSDFDTLLAMYTGTAVDALTEVASNDDTGGLQSELPDVPVSAGIVYSIAVDGWSALTGQIDLAWSFSDGTDTTPPVVTITTPADGSSFPQDSAVVAVYGCDDGPLGSGVASCVGDVPSGDPIDTSTVGAFTFTVTGIDNAGNEAVEVSSYSIVAGPPNDDFVNAEPLATDGSLIGTNVGATEEPGEPDHAGNVAGTSVWYRWTAPSDGFFTIDTFGSDFDTILAMYTGTAVDALTEVASNDDAGGLQSQLANVPVVGGTVYSIAVSGFIFATGQIDLEWSFFDGTDTTPPVVTIVTPADGSSYIEGAIVVADYSCVEEPLGSGVASCVGDVPSGGPVDTSTSGAFTFTVTGTDNAGNVSEVVHGYVVQPFLNDDFVNAELLVTTGNLLGTNVGATKEPGEPAHAGNAGGASSWFRWTAPGDGFFTIDTLSSDFDTLLAVYTGSAVDALTEVASNDNAAPVLQSELADIPVAAGTTYHIAVDGFAGAMGQIDLDWSFFDGPTFREISPPGHPLWVTDADHDFWVNAAAPADVDGDGDLDLAIIGYFVEYLVSAEDMLIVFINEGPDADGNWVFGQQDVPLGSLVAGASDLAWGDLDGDGDPDLAVGSEGATEIYLNDAGTLVPIATDLPGYYEDSEYTGAYDLRSLTWADADNDGDLDLLIPSTFDFTTFEFGTDLLRNDGPDGAGGWLFTDSGSVLDGTIHAQTAWADDDGDGDLDLFMANVDNFTDNSYVRTYRNEAGVFIGLEPIGSVGIEYGLGDWGDYDQDGDLDILIVGLVLDTDGVYRTVLRIYDNQAGVFVANTLIQSSFFPWLDLHAATWADYDSDGDTDILLTGTFIGETDIEGKSEIFVNEAGEFTPLGRTLPAPIGSVGNGGSFTWFDVDGDADLDYFVAGAYYVSSVSGLVEAKMNLYRNDHFGDNAAPSALSGLSATVDGDQVSLGWNPATDDHTASEAITYDLLVRPAGTAAAANKRLPEPGNVSAVTSWTLSGLDPGAYTWSVRAVDSAFNGGPAAERSFTIGGLALSGAIDGARGRRVGCRNLSSGQRVRGSVQGSTWDCSAAGLDGQAGDWLRVQLATRPAGGPVGGAVSGMELIRGRCFNRTSGMMADALTAGDSWSCGELPIERLDDLWVRLFGRVPASP